MRLFLTPLSLLILALPGLLAGCSDSSSGSDPDVRPLPSPSGELIFDRYQPLGSDQAIILDTHTWLAWERCARGQTWDRQGQLCLGQPELTSWNSAFMISDNAFALPSLEQLKSLVYCPSLHPTSDLIGQLDITQGCPLNDPRPTIHPAAFPDTPERTFWTRDADPNSEGRYLGIHFAFGGLSELNRPTANYAIRLVRDASELKTEQPEVEETTPET